MAQAAAQAALAGVTQPAAVVAMDGSGAIRAVVSTPIDQGDRALAGQYPPGSTFKIVTTDALLTAGMKPTDTLPCDPDVTVDGRKFQNFEAESFGPITLTEAFAKSCNTAFINGSKQLDAAQDRHRGRHLRVRGGLRHRRSTRPVAPSATRRRPSTWQPP